MFIVLFVVLVLWRIELELLINIDKVCRRCISWVFVRVVGILGNWLLSVYYYNNPNIREIASGKRPIKSREITVYIIYIIFVYGILCLYYLPITTNYKEL